jgi:membrane protease YdiL (CAAX protease family)
MTPEPPAVNSRREFIASPWHTLSILLVFAYFAFRASLPSGVASTQPSVSHGAMLLKYSLLIGAEWGMAYWAWVGVHWKGGNLRDLTGGRWKTWRSVALDIGIAIPFWVLWELTASLVHLVVARVPAPTASYQPPDGFAEIALWILLSISAGVCEEIVFRGYLQQQFRAATSSSLAAVVLQGAVFGLAHAYQGWKQVIVIATLGILYGALAAWRRNLRANMIAHAWSDIYEGHIKFVCLRCP